MSNDSHERIGLNAVLNGRKGLRGILNGRKGLSASLATPKEIAYIENDYEKLDNKPSINGIELLGNIIIVIPTKTSDLINDSGFLMVAPVQSVNGQTGLIVLNAEDVGALPDTTIVPTRTSQLLNDSGYITFVPVTSVNNKTGAVVLSASDIGALPDTVVIPTRTSQLINDSGFLIAVPVQSVNGQIGEVTLNANDVGALPSSTVIPEKTSELTNDSNFVSDADYVHTDNNFTNAEKIKLASVEQGAEANTVDSVNGKQGAVNLSASDVGALPDTTAVPTKTSQLQNDSNFVSDPSYVHTDSNFTTTEKNKLNGIEAGAEVNTVDSVNGMTGAVTVPNTTYTISISGNVITLTPSSGTAQSITLPVYSGGVI